jgi:hypothetical protein
MDQRSLDGSACHASPSALCTLLYCLARTSATVLAFARLLSTVIYPPHTLHWRKYVIETEYFLQNLVFARSMRMSPTLSASSFSNLSRLTITVSIITSVFDAWCTCQRLQSQYTQ